VNGNLLVAQNEWWWWRWRWRWSLLPKTSEENGGGVLECWDEGSDGNKKVNILRMSGSDNMRVGSIKRVVKSFHLSPK